jgi:hypothetical protein
MYREKVRKCVWPPRKIMLLTIAHSSATFTAQTTFWVITGESVIQTARARLPFFSHRGLAAGPRGVDLPLLDQQLTTPELLPVFPSCVSETRESR